MSSEDLERFVDAFIARERKARWKILLSSPKGRARLTATFAHGYDFDSRWATPLGTTATVEGVIAQLRAKGAGKTVDVLCEHSAFDGAVMSLEEAVVKFLCAGFGTYLICDPVRLAFFESEDVGGHFLLERSTAPLPASSSSSSR